MARIVQQGKLGAVFLYNISLLSVISVTFVLFVVELLLPVWLRRD